MFLTQSMPSWGPTALSLASIAVVTAALVVVVVSWRNRNK
ncbi:hypothetical protein FB471_1761 [Amycolatopsis cihanbeyliensis]|uniref:Uncharacterized protein n=1 Tax=Amycolatopsis cihanbeyliensis TaxID=1128664 RepID=A0A542DG69_AMYCI|nr:hypothetical protein FB471_1761 [Amycolatopsis cihanbeyliensis]